MIRHESFDVLFEESIAKCLQEEVYGEKTQTILS